MQTFSNHPSSKINSIRTLRVTWKIPKLWPLDEEADGWFWERLLHCVDVWILANNTALPYPREQL